MNDLMNIGTSLPSLSDLMNIGTSLLSLSQGKLISVPLYGSDTFDNETNRKILIGTLPFIKELYRFGTSLFKSLLLC